MNRENGPTRIGSNPRATMLRRATGGKRNARANKGEEEAGGVEGKCSANKRVTRGRIGVVSAERSKRGKGRKRAGRGLVFVRGQISLLTPYLSM